MICILAVRNAYACSYVLHGLNGTWSRREGNRHTTRCLLAAEEA